MKFDITNMNHDLRGHRMTAILVAGSVADQTVVQANFPLASRADETGEQLQARAKDELRAILRDALHAVS